MPRGIGSSGIGACTIASHLRHEQAGRTWRTTSKRPGMYSSTSVTLSPTLRSSAPPQALHTSAGACTMSRRGSSGGSWRRFFFFGRRRAGRSSAERPAPRPRALDAAGAAASALAASTSSSASSSCAMARSMRSELAPNFSRRSLASCAFSFSIVSG